MFNPFTVTPTVAMWVKEWHGSGTRGITAVSTVLLREWA